MAVSESVKRPYPPSTDDYKGKLCFITISGDENSLYILDFNSADADASTEFIDLPHALRFMGQLIFCVFNTQLHVIGAEDGVIYSDPKKLWMCKYDLDSPSPPLPNSLIDSSVLNRCRVSDMNASKWKPVVVPTPDGMILVYSRNIVYVSSSEGIDAERADFEVYDPKLNHWKKLPQLHLLPSWKNLELCLLDNSGNWTKLPGCGRGLSETRRWNTYFALTIGGLFINGSSTFLLTLDIGAMFTLNFDSLEEGWQAYQDPFIDGGGYEFVVAEPFVVTPYWVKDRRMGRDDKQMLPPDLPHDTTFEHSYRWPHFSILVLKYVEGQECFTCTVTTGFRRECERDSPYLICSIKKHDIAATDGDGDGDGGAHIPLNSFKYRLTGDDGGGSLLIQNAFVLLFESSLRTKRLKPSS